MRSLVTLEQALLEENIVDVKSYLSEIDRKTANEAFKLLGEYLGLTVLEICGNCYSLLASTSKILGYADPSGLRKLLERYQIWCPQIGTYGHDVRQLVRETFNLDPRDGQSAFVPYKDAAIEYYEKLTGMAFPRSKQKRLFD